MEKFFCKELEVVIFDVDGTLYRQSALRRIMVLKLLYYYGIRPWKYRDLIILYHFRKEREKRAGFEGKDLENAQYEWCAEKSNEKIDDVRKVVDKWIFNIPNRYLKSCMYPGVAQFITNLKLHGVKTAIYSDYNSKDKLAQMQLKVDLEVSSTDPGVDGFKPLPNGLLVVLSDMKITKKENCLFIGDRFELDGLCAANAGIPFLLVEKIETETDFYAKLSANFIQSKI